jgi:hypothetical protein
MAGEDLSVKLLVLSLAAVGLACSSVAAQAVESKLRQTSTLSVDALWEKVGDFCGISKWHPAIEKCELSNDGKTRTLSLKGGGTIVEHLVKWDPRHHSYTYTIVSSPLPVSHYFSTIKVVKDKDGSALEWSGHYRAKGVSDAESKKTIDGIYQAGATKLTGN